MTNRDRVTVRCIDNCGFLLYGAQSKNRHLRLHDDWGTHHVTKRSNIGDGKRSTGQVVWFNLMANQSGDLRDAEGAAETAKDLLTGFPL